MRRASRATARDGYRAQCDSYGMRYRPGGLNRAARASAPAGGRDAACCVAPIASTDGAHAAARVMASDSRTR
ncbi:acetate kinase [Burkholderia thailandensis]|nr:acetate kinase [Burkholderia thailandensis]AVR06949.1 acetate kinase [Burkholderia thailandensis]AWY61656.1 acetate kinase [Burkholderia thailandensis]AWY65739.1 acetate kinase [Burkholderia thailandensis]KVG10123.1 acetate kinase [Burkholderia thailandensis]